MVHEQPAQPCPPVSLLEEASEMVKTAASGSNVSSARDELIRDSRDVVAGFLKDNRMKSPAGRRKDMRGILACWAWIPLKNREAALVVHEVAVCVEKGAMPAGFGLRKTHHRQNVGHRFREWFATGASSFSDEGLCSRRAVLATPLEEGRCCLPGAVLACGN